MKKPTFSDLTPEERLEYGNGCGGTAKLLNVPDFIFTASCRHHDFNYERGGWPWHKVKADWDLFVHMWHDSKKWWHYVVSVVYFLGVLLTPISWYMFTYGKWRTKEEIILRDKIQKHLKRDRN